MNPLIQPKTMPPLLITLTLLSFGFLPRAQAVVPPPDGGYPGFNKAEGQNALFSLTTGTGNVAVGWARSTATLKATLTPLSAPERSFSIPQNKIPPPAQERFYSTIVVTIIRQTGRLRCISTPPVFKTQLPALTRFSTVPPPALATCSSTVTCAVCAFERLEVADTAIKQLS